MNQQEQGSSFPTEDEDNWKHPGGACAGTADMGWRSWNGLETSGALLHSTGMSLEMWEIELVNGSNVQGSSEIPTQEQRVSRAHLRLHPGAEQGRRQIL